LFLLALLGVVARVRVLTHVESLVHAFIATRVCLQFLHFRRLLFELSSTDGVAGVHQMRRNITRETRRSHLGVTSKVLRYLLLRILRDARGSQR